jgi:hypothetical protein
MIPPIVTPGWFEDDDDLPFDDCDPNGILNLYYAIIDLKREGVPDDFIREKRRSGELPAVAKTRGGLLLFDPRDAGRVIEAYWRSQEGRAVLTAWKNGRMKPR